MLGVKVCGLFGAAGRVGGRGVQITYSDHNVGCYAFCSFFFLFLLFLKLYQATKGYPKSLTLLRIWVLWYREKSSYAYSRVRYMLDIPIDGKDVTICYSRGQDLDVGRKYMERPFAGGLEMLIYPRDIYVLAIIPKFHHGAVP